MGIPATYQETTIFTLHTKLVTGPLTFPAQHRKHAGPHRQSQDTGQTSEKPSDKTQKGNQAAFLIFYAS